MMLKIVFLSYCNSIFSSRTIAKNLENNLSYIFLSGNTIVDYTTVCRFIVKYAAEITNIFIVVLYVCNKLKLVTANMIEIDGTKIKANAHKEWTGNRKEFEKLRSFLEQRIQKGIIEMNYLPC
jgi:transposase